MKNVLFVCTGNTCRSPMAEGLFRRLVRGRDDMQVASAGVSAAYGSRPSGFTLRILEALGVETGDMISQPVTEELLAQTTHVFALSSHHLTRLVSSFPEFESKFYGISEFSPDDDLRDRDVPDPFGGPQTEYQMTFEILSKLLPSVLAFLDAVGSDRVEV